MTKTIINDSMRESFRNAIHNRIRRRKSVLLTGAHGCGKTEILNQIKPKKGRVATVESLSGINMLLPGILSQLNYTLTPSWYNVIPFLELVCKQKNLVVIIDEAHELKPHVWPYLKRIMNAHISLVVAGLDSLETYLKEKHPDILSRFKILRLQPVSVNNYISNMSNWEPDAVELIYGFASGNMRVFDEIADDCEDKASEIESDIVTVDIAAMFI